MELAQDDDALARELGISAEAVALAKSAECIDLHLDSFIAHRIFGYELSREHKGAPLFGQFFGHVDFARAQRGHLTGAMWSITTNPFRSGQKRWQTFARNLEALRSIIDADDRVAVVRSHAEYVDARARKKHACMLAIQGGNAIDAAPDGAASIADRLITRVTLVHLTNSTIGATSSPFPLSMGITEHLTDRGRQMVAELNQHRIFVDLAHIHPTAFWEVVEAHDKTQPLIDTHTGVDGVKRSWRNLDDEQLKAIADTGGVVGIIFHKAFVRRRGGPKDAGMIVDHLEYICDTVGEDHAAIGSDFDGVIMPPGDMSSASHYPRLVQHMLDRGFSDVRIRKILGDNFLRAFAALRPE